MTRSEQVFTVVARVLELSPECVGPQLSRHDTEAWDSFNHLLLISSIEKETGARFTTAQIGQVKSVADILQIIEALAR